MRLLMVSTSETAPKTLVARLARAFGRRLDRHGQRVAAWCKAPRRRTLTDLAAIHGSDKGTAVGERHAYTVIYDRLLGHLQHAAAPKILEIGLRHDPYYRRTRRISPSLAMWRDYFPRAEIYGFDINDFSEMAGGRIHIFQGDQGVPDDLRPLCDAVDAFDVVIDDGSHASYHQRVTLATLFPKVRRGGLYILEDIHWQPTALEAELPPTLPIKTLLRDPAFLRDLSVPVDAVEILADGKLGVIRKR